ncbi:MAG: transcriptional regulator [Herbinix sp.]|jgi:DNA-binding MarR family transcriptional regulator|nr:transcriptional regulator [Herbinix sp.]
MSINDYSGFQNILELRSVIENSYFRAFEESIDFPVNLNHTHVRTMIFLKFQGEKPMSAVSNKLNLEKGSFTPVANHLIELGYIEKIPDTKDKRVYNLRLLASGEKLTNEIIEKHNIFANKMLDNLTADEKKSYFEAIELINELTVRMQKAGNHHNFK